MNAGVAQPAPLTGRQQQVYERLVERDGKGALAAMYLGALVVLDATANPDRVAHAAHSLRELMEKLPRIGRGDVDRGRMGDKAKDLEDVWVGFKRGTGGDPGRLAGQTIDAAHIRVFQEVESFVVWTQRNTINRKTQARLALEDLSVSGFAVPDELRESSVRAWKDLRDYFEDTAHHRGEPSEEQCRRHIEALEEFLLNLWLPDTFGDFAALDALMEADDAN
jgi:hypothetical protein